MPYIIWVILASVIISFSSQSARAHPGGLNGDGCHTNRKTGDYHCHEGEAGFASPGTQVLPLLPRPAYGQNSSAPAKELVQAVQFMLIALRFDPGAADGQAGTATRKAVDAYAAACDSEAPREISLPLLVSLSKSLAEATCESHGAREGGGP